MTSPASTNNHQPWLPLHIALHLVLLIIQIHLEDRQVLLPAFPRLQRQSVRRHPIDMTLRIGEGVMQQDDAREETEAEYRGEDESRAERGDRVLRGEGTWWERRELEGC
jgi:hypothetical protein